MRLFSLFVEDKRWQVVGPIYPASGKEESSLISLEIHLSIVEQTNRK